MKKLCIVAVLAIFSFTSVNAQGAKFGAKAGINFANFTGDLTENKVLTGFHIGAFVELELSEALILQPELLFSTQGTKFEESGVSFDFNANYVILPVMFKYAVAEGFNLEAGPQIGFLLSAEIADEDIKDEMESIDFGMNVGASYDFSEKLFAQARYNIGLSNIAKDSGDEKIQNSVISVSLGYRF